MAPASCNRNLTSRLFNHNMAHYSGGTLSIRPSIYLFSRTVPIFRKLLALQTSSSYTFQKRSLNTQRLKKHPDSDLQMRFARCPNPDTHPPIPVVKINSIIVPRMPFRMIIRMPSTGSSSRVPDRLRKKSTRNEKIRTSISESGGARRLMIRRWQWQKGWDGKSIELWPSDGGMALDRRRSLHDPSGTGTLEFFVTQSMNDQGGGGYEKVEIRGGKVHKGSHNTLRKIVRRGTSLISV
ncbi:hypothetical protein L218DRAFT_945435 [Marasmius fiardii PR-910]|nr:hypothetical protein L218DRAFT_945435 [Marasmius fiardii PR-910]